MMDFGHEPKKGRKYKKTLVLSCSILLLMVTIGLLLLFFTHNRDPIPKDIKSKASFKVIYPSSKSGQLGANGYQYQADQKSLTFSLNSHGTNIVFTEQPAPSSVGDSGQVYYQALGLHPYAQFASKLGPVALAKFYNPGTLSYLGQSGIMAAGGTLVTAHPDKDLTNAQWKDLFDSLKITK
jgi:hypothetical protein